MVGLRIEFVLLQRFCVLAQLSSFKKEGPMHRIDLGSIVKAGRRAGCSICDWFCNTHFKLLVYDACLQGFVPHIVAACKQCIGSDFGKSTKQEQLITLMIWQACELFYRLTCWHQRQP